jgi:hypothetical protein
MQVAYIEAAVGIRGANRAAQKVCRLNEGHESQIPSIIDESVLIDLIRSHSGLIQEIIVHVLDFRYVYNAQTELYISSIWNSWAHVPSVTDRIEHYILRTLCAISSVSEFEDSQDVFHQAIAELKSQLASMHGSSRGAPTIRQALNVLDDEIRVRSLGIQFVGARYVVSLTNAFFYDQRLNAELVRDSNTVVRNNRSVYTNQPGDFSGDRIESPVNFLLNRFEHYESSGGGAQVEFDSMWQMLQLI